MNTLLEVEDPIEQLAFMPVAARPDSTELTCWQNDLERSGITEEFCGKMGRHAPYPESRPDAVWYGILNNREEDECGYIEPKDLGEVLVFRYPGETFERDGGEWPFARVKPKNPRLSGNFDEWMENPDGSRRKLNARDRRQIEAARAGEETHGGTPCFIPAAYHCKDDRKPVKYESPRGLGQRLYDVIDIFHPEGLKDTDI